MNISFLIEIKIIFIFQLKMDNFLRWPNNSYNRLPGIFDINNMSKDEFNNLILKIVLRIEKNGDLYEKYDIENGIFSRLQRNENFNENLYNYVSLLRNLLWNNNNKFISYDELKIMLINV